MKREGPQLDYGGARGSNTGDVFHELWAVRQALRLLDASDTLTALTVEGVPAANSSDSGLDEVDCTLLFGGEDLQEAERVELQQLKYSAATPQKKWTVARACCGKNGKPETSLMRHLGNTFKTSTNQRAGKSLKSLKISLVTNQPISSKLANIFSEAQKGVPADFKRPWQPGEPDLHRVVHASGLPPAQFERFAAVVDFHGETGSRFAMEDKMLSEIAAWVNLSGANLGGANLNRVNLSGADLERAILDTRIFGGAKNLTAAQVQSAKNWRTARLPEDLKYLLMEQPAPPVPPA